MNIKVAPLGTFTRYGAKNYIVHKIDDERDVFADLVIDKTNYLILLASNYKYCITANEKFADASCDYIILTKKRPIKDQKIEFKRWLKHPKLKKYNPQSVIATWNGAFRFVEELQDENINGLRTPQVGAIYSALSHLKIAENIGAIVLPTGTGKTETMLSILIANKCSKVLVIVPSDALRKQLSEKFMTLGHLKKFGIVDANAVNPIVGVLLQKCKSVQELEKFFLECNVIVSTMSILGGSSDEQIRKMSEMCSHVFVDEAHHSKAYTWDNFIKAFDYKKVLLYTATPYRNDGQRLEGKIIFNFHLKRAQQEGYFKKINFKAIREYDPVAGDRRIAECAVAQLREDLSDGYSHILMARCGNKERAEEVFELYKPHSDLRPVLIHSSIPNKNKIINDIKSGKHFIIVCVDMLGEGFDLPELKIAAFHDIRKSLPITLQLAGRFTRSGLDTKLGEACFIANLFQEDVKEEIEELYAQDADWNLLLPELSSQGIEEQVDFQEFLSGFKKLDESKIPFQNIRPALSAVAYKNKTNGWSPTNFKEGIKNFDSYDYKFQDYNTEKKVIVILLGKKVNVDWGNFNEVYNIEWNIIIAYWETKNNLLFIHGSEKTTHFQALANALLGENNAELISGMDVFKVFDKVNRVALFNVGLRKGIGKNLSFQSYYGRSVGDAISQLQRKEGVKNNVFGIGYKDGEKISLGCSQKGRIWSYARGNLKALTEWCSEVGKKLTDGNIDPDTVLQGTLVPKYISVRPPLIPICVDWDPEVYYSVETRFEFSTPKHRYNLAECELQIESPTIDGPIQFSFHTEEEKIIFQLELSEKKAIDNTITKAHRIVKLSKEPLTVHYGNKSADIETFLMEYLPTVWFADGSWLTGNAHYKININAALYSKDDILSLEWQGVNLGKESQGVDPKITDSIQYALIHKLLMQDFDVVYDDDNAGEIADIIALKDNEHEIDVHLYHLKWAIGGVVSNQIKNLYEVCGQVQKSVHWKFKEGKEFFSHMLRREQKKKRGKQCSRLEKGTIVDLERFLRIAKQSKQIRFQIYIVQPGISRTNASEEILGLLGVTANYLMELANIELKVVGSD